MKRIERAIKAYDYSDKLTIKNEKYMREVYNYFKRKLYEDLTGFGMRTERLDVTAKALFNEDHREKAYVVAKEDGVIAGLEEATMFYETHGLEVKVYKKDGDRIREGEKIIGLEGYTKDLHKLARTGLDFLRRMSGIATAVRNLKDKIEDCDTVITATRKTAERYFDKKAVTVGGGLSHRLGLYDGILIKKDHLRSLKKEGIEDVVEEAIERAWTFKEHPGLKFIEIEVETYKDAIKAATKYSEVYKKEYYNLNTFTSITEILPEPPLLIMLDNMKPGEIKKVISKLKKEGLYDHVLLEASGDITQKNIERYAKAGVDAISMGCFTHSVHTLNLSNIFGEKI